jgi:hypothetical protein
MKAKLGKYCTSCWRFSCRRLIGAAARAGSGDSVRRPSRARPGSYLTAPRQLDDVGWRRPDQALDVPGPSLERSFPLAEILESVVDLGRAADLAGAVVQDPVDHCGASPSAAIPVAAERRRSRSVNGAISAPKARAIAAAMRSRPRPKPVIGLSPPGPRSEDPVFSLAMRGNRSRVQAGISTSRRSSRLIDHLESRSAALLPQACPWLADAPAIRAHRERTQMKCGQGVRPHHRQGVLKLANVCELLDPHG